MNVHVGRIMRCVLLLSIIGASLVSCNPGSPLPGSLPIPQTSSTATQLAPSPTKPPPVPTGTPTNPVQPVLSSENLVASENLKTGSDDWQGKPASGTGAISGFTDQPSVNVGGSILFAISTSKEGTPYLMEINRLGWYGGKGGRRVMVVNGLLGVAQGYWDPDAEAIVDCRTCQVDAQTGMIDTNWRYTYKLTIPADWVSGHYLVRLTDQDGEVGFIHFIVRDDARASDILVQVPYNMYQAGNTWGGYSLDRYPSQNQIPGYGAKPAVKVSFNRPLAGLDPNYLYPDIQAIHFLERQGYNVTYTTSVDVERNPAALQHHRAFLSIGDDPYWTKGMRDALEQAHDNGLNLAFLGGNSMLWQARYEPGLDGSQYRVLVVYREAALDPLAANDPASTTVRFIDPPVNRPQNSLTGMIFGGTAANPSGAPWVVSPAVPHSLLDETGLKPGDSVSSLTGTDCGTVAENGFSPPGLEILAASPLTIISGEQITCHTTFYQTGQGAMVFNAGTSSWTMALDDFGHHKPGLSADRRIQQLTHNVLALFGANPAGP